MRPTVGRIVHYTNLGDADGKYPPEQQAAIITKVTKRKLDVKPSDVDPNYLVSGTVHEEQSYYVSLHIFYETGDFLMKDVPFSKEYKRGHWTWPPIEG